MKQLSMCCHFHNLCTVSQNGSTQEDNKNWAQDGWGGRPKPTDICVWSGLFVSSDTALKFLEDRPPFMSWWEGKLGEVRKERLSIPQSAYRAEQRKGKSQLLLIIFCLLCLGEVILKRYADVKHSLSDDGFSFFSKGHRLFPFSLQQWAPIRFWIS